VSVSPSSIDLRPLLRQFGHETFRPGQERIIRDLLAGRDVLAVLPTGAGKSLVFQLAAQLLPGVTLVISPLIALMKDQAESLEAHGLEVGVVNSTRSAAQSAAALHKVERAAARLLYVTPERCQDEAFMAEVESMEVSLLVVDEAHCLSEWGFDFRPSYLALSGVAERLGRPALLALTATATPWVRRDIIDRLGLRGPDIVVQSIDRPHLFFEVQRVQTEEEDYRALRRLLVDEAEAGRGGAALVEPTAMRSLLAEETGPYPPELAGPLAEAMKGSGIVYTATTRAAQETAEWMRGWGIAADYYHGQRRKSDRDRIQDAFMAGELRVIAATNAFGLGVDKPDVRFVIHRDIPASVEEYYQEAGRAGRDGLFARCTLLYRPADLGRAAFLASSSQLSREDVRHFHRALVAHPGAAEPEIIEASGLSKGKSARMRILLQRQGVIEASEGPVRLRAPGFDPEQISLEAEASHREYEHSRLQMMRRYAELWECRRAYLLNYFGQEAEAARCGMCDNDWQGGVPAEPSTEEETPTALAFSVGDRVRHVRWGEGEVVAVDDGSVAVRFDHGEEKLATDLVQEEHLLSRVGRGRTPAGAQDGPGTMGSGGAPPNSAGPLSIGARVIHELFGEGEVERVMEEDITVLFERVGYKTVAAEALEAEAEPPSPREG
jgi:ATP-dependent DNA helicase RecQ